MQSETNGEDTRLLNSPSSSWRLWAGAALMILALVLGGITFATWFNPLFGNAVINFLKIPNYMVYLQTTSAVSTIFLLAIGLYFLFSKSERRQQAEASQKPKKLIEMTEAEKNAIENDIASINQWRDTALKNLQQLNSLALKNVISDEQVEFANLDQCMAKMAALIQNLEPKVSLIDSYRGQLAGFGVEINIIQLNIDILKEWHNSQTALIATSRQLRTIKNHVESLRNFAYFPLDPSQSSLTVLDNARQEAYTNLSRAQTAVQKIEDALEEITSHFEIPLKYKNQLITINENAANNAQNAKNNAELAARNIEDWKKSTKGQEDSMVQKGETSQTDTRTKAAGGSYCHDVPAQQARQDGFTDESGAANDSSSGCSIS